MVAPLERMPRDLAQRVAKIDTAIQRGRRDITLAGATAAKTAQLGVMRGHAGGDLRLSRVRSGRGAVIGAKYTLRDDTADVKATGPLQLLANAAKAHRIPKSNRKVIVIPGIGVRRWANHPGHKGKDTWNVGREKAEPRVKTAVARKSDEVVKRAFRAGG